MHLKSEAQRLLSNCPPRHLGVGCIPPSRLFFSHNTIHRYDKHAITNRYKKRRCNLHCCSIVRKGLRISRGSMNLSRAAPVGIWRSWNMYITVINISNPMFNKARTHRAHTKEFFDTKHLILNLRDSRTVHDSSVRFNSERG